MARSKVDALEVTIVSPTPRHISDEEVSFWLQILPEETMRMIMELDFEDGHQQPETPKEVVPDWQI
jgi:hypothetical protein